MKLFVAVIVIAIIAVAGCLTDEKSLQEDNQTKENVVTIRYLSSSAVVEPYEFANELGFFKGINIKRLGSTTGGPEDIMSVATGSSDVREYLSRNNMSKDDVQLLVMSHHEEVLRQGLVDVVAPVGAQIEKMETADGVRVLFSDYDIIGNQTHCGMFMSEKFIKENPEAVRQFVEASAKAADWAKDHPEEAKDMAAKIMKAKGGNPDIAKY